MLRAMPSAAAVYFLSDAHLGVDGVSVEAPRRARLHAFLDGLKGRAAALYIGRPVPTTAGRELVMVRRTEPSRDVRLLVERMGWRLPEQPPPRLRTVAGRLEAAPM